MNKLVITPDNEKDLTFLKQLLDRLGYQANEITEEELEDAVLLEEMVKAKEGNYVDESVIRNELHKK